MNSSQAITRRLKEFEYYSPSTVEEALSILGEHNGKAVLFAGGTDLLSMMKTRKITPSALVSLKKIEGLNYIREEGGTMKIGALTGITTIGESDSIRGEFFSLYETTRGFATPQIRNMATIGGNICRSSPCANTPPPLITFGAQVKLVGEKGERTVLLEEFFAGAGENVLDREVLVEIIVPLATGPCGTAFMELTRNSSDVSKVTCAVRVAVCDGKCSDIKIVLGSVADRIVRARKAEETVSGRKLDERVIEEAAENVVHDISPITDVRSEADYRMHVSKVLVKRAIKRAIERIK